ncbi:MAG TPA: L-threonylcarbamoyladenylate synthase [Candidatus Eisenbacteria bacterium]|nr:L-threonylcarbamoyladenylate synthase [Candidatus Eisenbacteria bacterium]
MKDKKPEFDAAVAALNRGEVIVFPTETLYGLGADALNAAAVERVFHLKGRDAANPISVVVADRAMLCTIVGDVPRLAEQLIAEFWPGPLTLVLPAKKDLSKHLVNARGGVGVRISSAPIAAELLRELGKPITATSANPSGKNPARRIDEAKRYFSGEITVFIDGGELHSNVGSTVAEISGDKVRVIREGEITKAALEQVIGKEKVV